MSHVEIERLLKLERYYRDTEQWGLWRKCYHPDSSKTSINISWFKGEIDEWERRSRSLAANGVATLHTVAPIDVQMNGYRAYSISSCRITSRFEYEGADFDLIAELRLVSRIEHVESQGGCREWKITSLEGIYLQDSIIPIVPLASSRLNIDLSGLDKPRASYKCLTWNIERKGLTARRDLPGIDEPASVKTVMDGIKAWLEMNVSDL